MMGDGSFVGGGTHGSDAGLGAGVGDGAGAVVSVKSAYDIVWIEIEER